MAAARAYRWGEDGLAAICDLSQRLCIGPALWNGHDPILKERLFGLTNGQGNHGEDVKELYYYLDATPTASYAEDASTNIRSAAFPYARLVAENAARGREQTANSSCWRRASSTRAGISTSSWNTPRPAP